LAAAIFSPARFWVARDSSSAGSSSRRRASSVSTWSTTDGSTRLRSSPARTPSGSSRISFRSSTAEAVRD
jgi:hypothetical protein